MTTIFNSEDDSNDEISWAKEYYNSTLLPDQGNTVAKSSSTSSLDPLSKKVNVKSVFWFKAMAGKTSMFEFIEVPLKYTTKIVSTINDSKSPKATKNVILASFDRLVIYKDKNGKIDQRIISYVPDIDYLERSNNNISHNTITNIDKDFSGHLFYKNWKGETLFILKFKDGKAVSKFNMMKLSKGSVKKSGSKNPTTSSEECPVMMEICEWFVDCYYEADNPFPLYCGDPYSECSEPYPDYSNCGSGGGETDCLDPANFYNAECGYDGGEPCVGDCPYDPELDMNFCDNSETNQSVKTAIEENVDDYKAANCATKKIYGILSAAGFQMSFCVNSQTQGNARYNPENNTVNYSTDYAAGMFSVLEHEMFHAYQDHYYGGTESFGFNSQTGQPEPGFVNVEFEQIVMRDILNQNATAFNSGSSSQQLAYSDWLITITNGFSKYPDLSTNVLKDSFTSTYSQMLYGYNNLPNNYYSSTILTSWQPEALMNIFLKTTNNCQ